MLKCRVKALLEQKLGDERNSGQCPTRQNSLTTNRHEKLVKISEVGVAP